MPRNAVLYARKSSQEEEQRGETSKSVADQFTDMRRYAEAQGFVVVAEKYDDAISGREDQTRPGFMEMRRLIEAGEVDTVVLDTKSRLFRNSAKRELMMQDLDDRGVEVHAVSGGGRIKRDTAHDWFVDGLDGLMDDRLWRERSEGWRKTLARRLEQGLPKHGLPRFGYIYNDKRYTQDPATAPILADLYRRFVAGAGVQSLRKELNERGVTTTRGGQWSVTSLTRVLDSGWGAGLIITGDGTYLPGAHEPVIDADLWQRYQDARQSRRKEPPRRKVARWHLTGVAVCGLCGARMHSKTVEAVCSNYSKKGKDVCTGTFILRTTLEHAVALWVGGAVNAFPAPQREAPDTTAQTLVADLEGRLGGVTGRLERLATGWASGILDDDGYRAAQRAALAERDDIESQLRAARQQAENERPLTEDEWSRLELGDSATPGEWNGLLKRVLQRVEVHKDRLVIVPVSGEPVTRRRTEFAATCRVWGCDRVRYTRGICKHHVVRARGAGVLDALVDAVADDAHSVTVEDVEKVLAQPSDPALG